MDLIVTHNNADFDAFGSAIAAKKLYPDSKILLPGSQERAVREFLSLSKDKIRVESEKACDFSDVSRLIILDTRHRSRIGKAEELLDKGIETHIYDHHPRMREDIKGDIDIREEVGSTVTILLKMLKKKRYTKISPLEATIMLLGVYEETGSLTYRTTTKSDVDVVSFLLGRGANLEAVSAYLNRELKEDELKFLVELINKTELHVINGVSVALSCVEVTEFEGELATLVHKLQEVENHPVLFAIFKVGERIRIIARSREPKVDVNKILQQMGGGGHAQAATAQIKDGALERVKKELLDILKTKIKVDIYARDIMSYPVKTISVNKKIRDAKRMLERLNIKGAPCVENKRLAGIITRRDIDKAMKHGFGHSRVKGYMQRDVITAKENMPLHMIQKTMFERNIGRLPIMRKDLIAGIVTRTDVLKRVHSDLFLPSAKQPTRRVTFNLSGRMKAMLPEKIYSLLKTIGSLAGKQGHRSFIVGGFVRDMLLGVKNFDVDIVLEGDAMEFGSLLAKILKGSLVIHRKFGTSTVVTDWPKGVKKPDLAGPKFKIDLATARRETYKKPAALPSVRFSSLKNDLLRRDFSINSMAASLNKKDFGELVDFFNGMHDLKNRRIRVLHEASFIDDPTRIFRAVRFEQRYSFRIDPYTERLIKNAVKQNLFKKTEDQRIRDEIILILKEKNPLKAIKRMKEFHELKFIHPRIKFNKQTETLFGLCRKVYEWYVKTYPGMRKIDLYLMYLMALADSLDLKGMRDVCSKFVFRKGETKRLIATKKNVKKVITLLSSGKAVMPSAVYSALERLSYETILFALAKADNAMVKKRVGLFFKKYNGARIKLGGEDLKKLGVKPGPGFKKILGKILFAKLDGKISSKKDEMEYLKTIIHKKEEKCREGLKG